jgi:glycosyltransferase involved in cell wall biosynthesis
VADRPPISVVLITRNEASRIRRCLDSVRWAEEIVVVDQHSADDTAAICRAYGARVIERPMSAGFGEQKNFAIAQASHPWILSLDADEEVTPALRQAIEAAVAEPGPALGFRMPRLTSYLGRFIRHCGWYPSPVLRLFRRGHGRFTDALVHEEVVVDGPVGDLGEDLRHYSYDSLSDHVRKLLVYTAYDARMLRRRGARLGPLRLLWWLALKPPAVFVRKYVLQRGYREGWHGFVLSAMAALVVLVNAVRLAELTGRLGRPVATATDAEPPTILLMANFADIVGGGEESLLGLAARLDRGRLRVVASVTAEGEVGTRLRALGVPVHVVRLPPVRPWTLAVAALALIRLRRLLRREQVALVHSHGSRGTLYAGLATRGLDVPLVWHVRVAEPDPRLDRLLARLAAAIIVNSNATAARLGRLAGAAGKVTVVPNGVDPARFAPGPADPELGRALGLAPTVPVVGYFGRLERGKGVDVLVDAAARLHDKLPATAFLFVGDGPLRETLSARAAAVGLPACFAGYRDDVAALLRLCTVVVLPSRQEAFGRILIEAMASGVPVVATAVGGIPEVCTDGVTALLVPPEDPDALAVAIALTLADQAATGARVAAAAADVRGRFDLAAHAARVQAVYARMLGVRGAL